MGAPKQEACTRCEARRSGDGEGVFLEITYSLAKQRSDTLVWVLQRGLWGSVNSSIPREKIRLSRVSCIYIQAINLFCCDPYFPLLVCLTRTIAC